jgi:TetR/AcrR family transcriptional regulator, ethionamide resistance regulator
MPPTAPMRRKPRAAEDSEREILESARQLLRERPFRQLSVNAIMENTGLARPSFYVHFRDRHDIVLRVVATIGDELFEMSERWFADENEPVESVRRALEGVAEVYLRHGQVLKAVADAATDDPEVEQAYRELVERFIEAATEHIRMEQRAGRALAVDPARTARALVWLNERYLSEMLGRVPQADAGEVVETLHQIWVRSIYSDQPI